MLISKGMQDVVRVLLNRKEEKFSMREIAKEACVSLGMTAKIMKELVKTGYARKAAGLQLLDWKRLLNAFAYSSSVSELSKIEFSAAERPQYLIKKIAEIAKKAKLRYALTLFSATEIVMPYVTPSSVHLYILEEEEKKWQKELEKENIFPAEKGNIVCFLVDKKYFYGTKEIRGINIISLPQLYADLFSLKGRGEEAASELLKIM